jgi:hypothetical protein
MARGAILRVAIRSGAMVTMLFASTRRVAVPIFVVGEFLRGILRKKIADADVMIIK